MVTPPFDAQKTRLAELKKEVPTRGLERYPSLLKNLSELPIELQSPAVQALAAGETVQTIISFPPQIQHGWDYVPKQALLFMRADVIHILASIWPGHEPQITYLTACELLYMRIELLLLYGCLEIVAQGQDSPAHLRMEFNTVSWDYLSRPLQQLLRYTESGPGAPRGETGHSIAMQDALQSLPFKFSNGVKIYGLLPGQQLLEMVYQPAYWKRQLAFSHQQFSANTLLLLTTNYMVVIQEEFKVNQGWILSYIPWNNIIGIQNQSYGAWNELSVQLRRENQSLVYKLKLRSEAVEAWRIRWIQHGSPWEDLPERQA
jgi:hypothetical protein